MDKEVTRPGRPRSFDEGEALSKATAAFWEHGFAGTSYPALESATGLRRQSLRYAFGDKEQLFERVVAHYAEQKVGHVVALLARPGSPLGNIRNVLDLWARDARHPSRRGCLMVNALAELGSSDNTAVRAIDGANRRLTDAFEQAFAAAQHDGEVRTDLDPRDLAIQTIALGDGFLVHSRSRAFGRRMIPAIEAYIKLIAL